MLGRILSATSQQFRARFQRSRRERLKRQRRLSCEVFEPRLALAAADFEFYRRTQVTPVGGGIQAYAQPNIASLGDTVFAVGDDYASRSVDNGVTWDPVDPLVTFQNKTGPENDWDNAGFGGFQRLATDPTRGLVAWLGMYDPVIPVDMDGNPDYESAENGARLAVARSEADLQNGDFIVYDFSMYHLGQVKGVFMVNPQMQVSAEHLYMTADFVELREEQDAVERFYRGTAWWRVGLDTLEAGGDVERGVTFLTQEGPIGLAYGSQDVMYGATNVNATRTIIYKWNDNDLGPTSVQRSGLNPTTSDRMLTSYQKEVPDVDTPVPVPNKVQTGWVGNGKVGFMWNSNPRPFDGLPNPFVRALVLNEADLSLNSQPDLFSGSQSFFYPAAATNARGDVAVVVGRYTGTGAVTNDILIDDGFNGVPTAGNGWERYQAATGSTQTGTTQPEVIAAGRYYGIMADDNFPNTWLVSGFTVNGGAAIPRFYWFGRELDHPEANLHGIRFDLVQDTVQPSQPIRVQYEIHNEGITDAGSFNVSFYASDDDTIDIGDTLIGTTTIAGLDAGTFTGLLTRDFVMPPGSDPFWDLVGTGNYFVGMVIDSGDEVAEYDESDNSNEGISIDYSGVFAADFDNNDNLPNASDLGFLTGVRSYERLNINPPGDQDWYKVVAPFDGTLTTQINFANVAGDLNLTVRNSLGVTLDSSLSTTNNTETTFITVTAGETFYIQVLGAGTDTNSYELNTDYRITPTDARESNGTLQSAANLGSIPVFSEANLNVSQFDDEDYYVFTAIGAGAFTASIDFLAQFGNLDLYLYNQGGALLDSSTGTGNTESVNAQLNVGEQYYIRVNGGDTDTNVYRLDFEGSVPPVYVNGNTVVVTGSDQDDTFEFIPETPDIFTNIVIVNDVAFSVPASSRKYVFRGGGGVNTVIVNGTSRVDTLTASPTTATMNAYTMNLSLIQKLTLDGQAGNDTIRTSGPRAITGIGGDGNDNITGGSLNDLLRGGLGDDVLSGSGGNDTLRGEVGNDRMIDGPGNDLMAGGLGNDTYFFTEPVGTQVERVEELTNGGIDSFNFSLSTSPVTVTLANDNRLAVQGARTVRSRTVGQAINLENIIGSAGNDLLIGNNNNNAITGGEGNDRMEGRQGDDTYAFANPQSAQVDTIREVNELGSDTLSFANSTIVVTADLNLQSGIAVQGSRRVNMAVAGQQSFMENVIGSRASDTLQGNAAGNLIEGGDGDDTMIGRGGNDVYFFRNAQSPQVDTITEVAGPGRDTLDFSGLTNSLVGVTVDLTATGREVATHAGRIVNMAANGQARFLENLRGGAGNDLLVGNNSANTILGNNGRDILIGGVGADNVDGGNGDDILVGGSTSNSLQQLQLIRDEWIRTDLGYAGRVSNVRGPTGGLNGSNFLTIDTVFDDFSLDSLVGGGDFDYFWIGDNDVSDVGGGETSN